jgi:hypothetical protein
MFVIIPFIHLYICRTLYMRHKHIAKQRLPVIWTAVPSCRCLSSSQCQEVTAVLDACFRFVPCMSKHCGHVGAPPTCAPLSSAGTPPPHMETPSSPPPKSPLSQAPTRHPSDERILIFNCLDTRDPVQLLEPFAASSSTKSPPNGSNSNANSSSGQPGSCPTLPLPSTSACMFDHAVFVPGESIYACVKPGGEPLADVSWQMKAAHAWDTLLGPSGLSNSRSAASDAHTSTREDLRDLLGAHCMGFVSWASLDLPHLLVSHDTAYILCAIPLQDYVCRLCGKYGTVSVTCTAPASFGRLHCCCCIMLFHALRCASAILPLTLPLGELPCFVNEATCLCYPLSCVLAFSWKRLRKLSVRMHAGRGAVHTGQRHSVHSSLKHALACIRLGAASRSSSGRSGRLHVLVTGSLHLVGDVLRHLGLAPV